MGICLNQYRAVVGLFHNKDGFMFLSMSANVSTFSYHDHSFILSFTFLIVFAAVLLTECLCHLRHVTVLIFRVLSTSIHPNPGPVHNIVLNKFSVCHANVRSLKSDGKLEEISILAESEKLEVISLSETWLDTSYPDALLAIEGFQTPLRKDRETGLGGGVALYVKDNLPVRRCAELETPSSECIWAEITVPSGKLILGVYYRPPGQSAAERDLFLDNLSHSISSAIELNPKILLLTGDFNDCCVSCDSPHTDSDLGQCLFDLLA